MALFNPRLDPAIDALIAQEEHTHKGVINHEKLYHESKEVINKQAKLIEDIENLIKAILNDGENSNDTLLNSLLTSNKFKEVSLEILLEVIENGKQDISKTNSN